jgi:hypothetical protein
MRIDRSFWWRRFHLAGTLVLVIAAAQACRAQVRGVVIREVEAAQPPGGAAEAPDEEDEAGNGVVQPAPAVFVMNDDQFDQWVFGGPRNSGAGRNKLDSLLMLQVDDVARTCDLSELQKKKLLLAGHGDIKRFFERVDEKRKKFDKVKNDQNKINEIYQELQPLQVALNSGLFSDGSLFSKTLKRVLEREQAGRYEGVLRDKRQFRYRAKVELIVASLDQSIGFSDEQRRKLVELILKETAPPRRFGQYDYWLVMYQASRIPTSELRPIFDDKQWGFVRRQLDQMRGMEQFLRQNGMLPEEQAPGFVNAFVEALHQAPAKDVAAEAKARELPDNVYSAPSEVKPAAKRPAPEPRKK